MQNKSPKPREREIHIPLVRSPTCVTSFADGATLITKADELGATIQINFTRLDLSPTSEKFTAIEDTGMMTQTSPSVVNESKTKYVECCVILRPDQALAIAAHIVQTIQSLPPQIRALYRIPDVNPTQGVPR